MANWRAPLLLGTLLALLASSGCSSLFFYPDRVTYIRPDQLDLDYQQVTLNTSDGEQLAAWWLPAQGQSLGTIYYLHGNAQNMSAHILNVAWLPEAHYNVFMIDYRGFGRSTGEPDLAGALNDAETGLRWVFRHHGEGPVYLLGQSLGAALTLDLAGSWPADAPQPTAVVADAAFAGFRSIAREKLDSFWLTWPLQIPLSWTIPDNAEPIDYIGKIAPTPLLLIHSHRDGIIPFQNGLALFQAAGQPKRFIATETPHAATFVIPQYRRDLVGFLAAARQGELTAKRTVTTPNEEPEAVTPAP